MLPSPTEATTEEKTTLVRNDAVSRTTEDHTIPEKLESRIKTHQNQHRRRRGYKKIATSAAIATTFHSTLNFKRTFLGHGVSSQFPFADVTCVSLHCEHGFFLSVFFQSKNKDKPIAISEAIDDSCMWKDNGIYGLFSKSGSGDVRL